MNYGITFDYYIGTADYTWSFENNCRTKIFFGKTKLDLDQAINQYGSELEKYNYRYGKEEKYYNNLFEYLEDVK